MRGVRNREAASGRPGRAGVGHARYRWAAGVLAMATVTGGTTVLSAAPAGAVKAPAPTWSIEQRIRAAVPDAARVIVHAEPAALDATGVSP